MTDCCKNIKNKRSCTRKSDKKKFKLPRRFTKTKCKRPKGFTMRSSCAPFKDCFKKINKKKKQKTKKYKHTRP